MRKTTFARLALFGLATLSSYAFAANMISGEIRFDATFNLGQKTAAGTSAADNTIIPDNLNISRARLDFSGDLGKNWNYFIRAEYNEYENAQLNQDYTVTPALYGTTGLPVLHYAATATNVNIGNVFSRAYATWMPFDGVSLMMGRIGCPDISADNIYFKPYIGSWPNNKTVGSLVDYSGDHPGISIVGSLGLPMSSTFGYSAGLWKETDLRKLLSFDSAGYTDISPGNQAAGITTTMLQTFTDGHADLSASSFDSKSLRLGYAGRLSLASMISSAQVGLGVGFNQAPLIAPVVVATSNFLHNSGDSRDGNQFTLAAFNMLTNWAVDAAAVFGAFQINAGFQDQTLKLETSQDYLDNGGPTITGCQIFSENGKATAWWVEAGYLFMGNGYKFDAHKAVVTGVKMRDSKGALEISARFGTEIRKNVLALMNQPGFDDFNAATNQSPLLDAANIGIINGGVGYNDAYLLISTDNSNGYANATPAVPPITLDGKTAYQAKMTGYAVNVNYYVDEHTVIKAEFEQRNNKFERMSSGSDWSDSLNAKTVSTLRLRGEFSF
jgi:hypothetical protein